MEQISGQIERLVTKIDDIEELLKKSINKWSKKEKNMYGIEEQEAKKQLMEKEMQLMEKKCS
jgi:hypothetical protein